MFWHHRPLIIASLTSWLAIACISGQDLAPMGAAGKTSSSVSGDVGGGNSTGGAISGNTGGSRTTAGATGGAVSGNTGGSVVVGNGGTSAGTTGGAPAGATGGQGTNSTGGIEATGGAPSTAPAPNASLGVYIDTQNNGGGITGDQSLHLRVEIVNTSSTSQDLAAVTMRYWYVDDGWGSTQLTMENDYVSIGYSSQGTVTYGGSFAVTPAQTGADHYFEFSFTGTLAAANDIKTNDKFHVQVRIHPTNNSGTVNVSNDYSVMNTTGYDDKITLYSAGSLIWGTEPGGSSTPSGTGGASGVGGSSASSGGSSSPDTASAGGNTSVGGTMSTGGDTSAMGGAATGGDTSAMGGAATGGDTSTTGGTAAGGDTSAIGGDTSNGGVSGLGGDSSQGGST